MLLAESAPRSRRFAPGWPLWVFTLALLPILLGLGSWQLQRAAEKRVMQAAIDAVQQTPALPLASFGQTPPADWQPLILHGQLDPQHVWLLDNRTRDGHAGVEVLQAFKDTSGSWLLINRGWLAWPDRRQLPTVDTPSGELQLLAEKLPASSSGWRPGSRQCDSQASPCVLAQLDLHALRDESGIALHDWSARLTGEGTKAALQLDWPALPMSASRHVGYAIQWFGLAAALLALFIWAGFRPDHRGNNNDEPHRA
ncbi:MAG: SURF1 family protein [Pseudomonadaceae bacterium]